MSHHSLSHVCIPFHATLGRLGTLVLRSTVVLLYATAATLQAGEYMSTD